MICFKILDILWFVNDIFVWFGGSQEANCVNIEDWLTGIQVKREQEWKTRMRTCKNRYS